MALRDISVSARIFLALEVVLATSVIALWFFLWRYPIWSIDDLYFVTRDGYAWGGTSFTSLWQDLLYDVGDRNGRTADIVLQIVLVFGEAAAFIFPLICIFFSVAVYRFIRIHIPREVPWQIGQPTQFVVFVISAMSLFIIDALAFQTAGTTIMFMAATVGYLGGFILFYLVVGTLLRIREGSKYGVHVAFLLLTLLASLHHEMVAVMLFVYFVAFLLSHQKLPSRTLITVLVAMGIALMRFGVPGMWARNERIEKFVLENDSFLVSRASTFLYSLQGYVSSYRTFWFATLVFIVLLTISAALMLGVKDRRVLTLVELNLFGLAIFVYFSGRLGIARNFVSGDALPGLYQSPSALVSFVALVTHLICMATLAVLLRKTLYMIPLIPLACAYGATAMTAFAGNMSVRSMFLVHVLLVVFICLAIVVIVQNFGNGSVWSRRFTNQAIAASILVVLAIALKTVNPMLQLIHHVNANVEVQAKISKNIGDIRKGESDILYLPEQYPYEDYFTWYQPRESVQERYLFYYDLPADTPVRIVPPDEMP
ncbi:hypothetical protein [Actinomyces sp. S4-C9]|uniref:hypothetical protein n=2 Tax=unclassified Actinomyces TaxID=2609248 RepID=UPI000689E766|nr:hypothetical protein [Actinomyces sp. S4-C9]